MKTVFSNNEIPHLWAHQTQAEGRNANRSFYFEGDTIYSYGSHFPIARHVTNERGERAVLVTTRSYSVTTQRHISRTRSAIPSGTRIFYVHNPGDRFSYECDYAVQEIRAALERAATANKRNAPKHLDKAISIRDSVLELAAFYAVDIADTIPAIPNNADLAAWQAAELKAAEERNARRAKEDARLRAKALHAFHAGDSSAYFRLADGSAALRIDGDEVVTSMGARFPLDHARKGLQLVRAVIARGAEFTPNGHSFHLGHYSIDSIEVNGTVHAGCHVVSYAEIERIAAQLESNQEVA